MSEAAEPRTMPLADQIMQLVRDGKVEVPPYPELAMRLQETLAKDDVGAGEIAELISNEPALVSSVLRVANSVAFGGLQPIADVPQAIARLGLSQVGSIGSATLLKGSLESEYGDDTLNSTLWDHSVTTAFAAKVLAQRIGANENQAFLGGLLHDCGNSLVLSAVQLLRNDGLDLNPTDALLEELMTTLHCRLGHLALETWKLPTLAEVVLHHEDPAEETEDLTLLCVQAADCITRKLGFDLHPDPELPLMQEPAIESLGIEDVELATLMVDLEDHLEDLRQLF